MTLSLAIVAFLSTGPLAVENGQVSLAQGLKQLADTLASRSVREQKTRVGVLPFRELDGRETVLGVFLAEELTTHLAAHPNLQIIERTVLDKLLGEMLLGESGVIDAGTAKRIGKVAGVEAIVSGTVTDLETSVALNCRLIDVETGRVFAAGQARINKDGDVARLLSMSAAGSQGRTSGGTTSREPGGAVLRPGTSLEGDIGVERQAGYWLVTIDNVATTDQARTVVGNIHHGVASDHHVLICIRLGLQSSTQNPREVGSPHRRLQKTDLMLVEVATGRRFDPEFFRDVVLSRPEPSWVVFDVPETVSRDLLFRVHRRPSGGPAEFKLRIK